MIPITDYCRSVHGRWLCWTAVFFIEVREDFRYRFPMKGCFFSFVFPIGEKKKNKEIRNKNPNTMRTRVYHTELMWRRAKTKYNNTTKTVDLQ